MPDLIELTEEEAFIIKSVPFARITKETKNGTVSMLMNKAKFSFVEIALIRNGEIVKTPPFSNDGFGITTIDRNPEEIDAFLIWLQMI